MSRLRLWLIKRSRESSSRSQGGDARDSAWQSVFALIAFHVSNFSVSGHHVIMFFVFRCVTFYMFSRVFSKTTATASDPIWTHPNVGERHSFARTRHGRLPGCEISSPQPPPIYHRVLFSSVRIWYFHDDSEPGPMWHKRNTEMAKKQPVNEHAQRVHHCLSDSSVTRAKWPRPRVSGAKTDRRSGEVVWNFPRKLDKKSQWSPKIWSKKVNQGTYVGTPW